MDEDKLQLLWHKFPDNIVFRIRQLFEEQHSPDVTLVTEDGIHIGAHKIVLASNSKFLAQILLSNPEDMPMLYLKDVHHDILLHVLEFVYTGKCRVDQDKMIAVFSVGKELQIPHLTPSGNTENDAIVVHPIKEDHVKLEGPAYYSEDLVRYDDADNSLEYEGVLDAKKFQSDKSEGEVKLLTFNLDDGSTIKRQGRGRGQSMTSAERQKKYRIKGGEVFKQRMRVAMRIRRSKMSESAKEALRQENRQNKKASWWARKLTQNETLSKIISIVKVDSKDDIIN